MGPNGSRAAFLRLFNIGAPKGPYEVPLLAHYTSRETLEGILKNEELWLGSPLHMNDHEELRFGVFEGQHRVANNSAIVSVLKDKILLDRFAASFHYAHHRFLSEDIHNVFAMCFCEHHPSDKDGRLSMWRAYGANASGACIVFDPSRVPEVDNTPFVLLRVTYASAAARRQQIDRIIYEFCDIINSLPLTEQIAHEAAHYLFQSIVFFSLYHKDLGFYEENEWRLVYRSELDDENKYVHMIDSTSGPRGFESRLKLKLRSMPDFTPHDISIESLVDRIILGPTISDRQNVIMFHRVLDKLGKGELKDRVYGSTIPYIIK